MKKPYVFSDALKILGADDPGALKVLDTALSGLLLLGAIPSGGATLQLFDPKNDLIAISRDLLLNQAQRFSQQGFKSRQERISAAHTVITIVSYFDILAEHVEKYGESLELEKEDQLVLTALANTEIRNSGDTQFVQSVLSSNVDLPRVGIDPSTNTDAIRNTYEALSRVTERFISGLAVWDRLSETARTRIFHDLRHQMIDEAVQRYTENYRWLAARAPEFLVWALTAEFTSLAASQQSGFDALRAFLSLLSRPSEAVVVDLDRSNDAAQQRQLIDFDSAGLPAKITIPTLHDGYVRPNYRWARSAFAQHMSDDSWWRQQPLHENIERFLTAAITSPDSKQSPVILLGHPGAGKSALCRILAAALPAQFIPIVVKLRDVPASAPLQKQIELSLYQALGREQNYVDLATLDRERIPVIFLDGFDELLQASGVAQSDYLERAAEFQLREAELGRGAVILVTSRTVVIDQARIPDDSLVVRLEDFDDKQIGAWLEAWNESNSDYYQAAGLLPLSTQVVSRLGDIARQPLLLALLTLFDAVANDLPRDGKGIKRTIIYEKLLELFLQREAKKTMKDQTQIGLAVQESFSRLAVAAFAMFNRGSQKCTEQQLSTDLAALGGGESSIAPVLGAAVEAVRTPGEEILGTFFFLVDSQATVGNKERLGVYEFLHSTFGEYLIARELMNELSSLASVDTGKFRPGRKPQVLDDSWLAAVCSHEAFLKRTQILDFWTELSLWSADRPANVKVVLEQLLRSGPERIGLHGDVGAYKPTVRYTYEHNAIYTLNLFALLQFLPAAQGERNIQAITPLGADSREWLHRLMRFWRAGVDEQAWLLVVETFGWLSGQPNLQLLPTSKDVESLNSVELLRAATVASFLGERDISLMLNFASSIERVIPAATVSAKVLSPTARADELKTIALLHYLLTDRRSIGLEGLRLLADSALEELEFINASRAPGLVERIHLFLRQFAEDAELFDPSDFQVLFPRLVELLDSNVVGGPEYGPLVSLIAYAVKLSDGELTGSTRYLLARLDFLGMLDMRPEDAAHLYFALINAGIDLSSLVEYEDPEFVYERLDIDRLLQSGKTSTAITLFDMACEQGISDWAGTRGFEALEHYQGELVGMKPNSLLYAIASRGLIMRLDPDYVRSICMTVVENPSDTQNKLEQLRGALILQDQDADAAKESFMLLQRLARSRLGMRANS